MWCVMGGLAAHHAPHFLFLVKALGLWESLWWGILVVVICGGSPQITTTSSLDHRISLRGEEVSRECPEFVGLVAVCIASAAQTAHYIYFSVNPESLAKAAMVSSESGCWPIAWITANGKVK